MQDLALLLPLFLRFSGHLFLKSTKLKLQVFLQLGFPPPFCIFSNISSLETPSNAIC